MLKLTSGFTCEFASDFLICCRKCVILFGMLCFRQRFSQTNNLFILCSLLLAAGFMLQIKSLYNNHQKQLRLQEYRQRINDVTETINAVEKLANYTSSLMKKLQMVTKPHRFKKTRLKPI